MSGRFVIACSNQADFVDSDLIEVAVAGRSNCGKSTLINGLVGQRKLARTSQTPGRTRQVIFFEVRLRGAPRFHLVDLPGYGYAKVSKSEAAAWAPLIEGYVEGRRQLRAMLLLSDIRRQPGDEERDLLRWCADRGLEPVVVLTKADKIKKNQRFIAADGAKRALGLSRRPLCFSSRDASSIEALRRHVVELVKRESAASPAAPGDPGEPGDPAVEGAVIGLTGGIAAGKSLVATMLAELGAQVVDADELAREVVAPGSEALARIVARFGEEVLDPAGALDRARLAALAFADDQARGALEAITHPAIATLSCQRIAEHQAGGAPLTVYEAALLVETGRHRELGPLVVVVADEAQRIERLMARDALGREAAEQRLAAQVSQQRKAELADHVIDNSGSIEQTRAQVERLYRLLIGA